MRIKMRDATFCLLSSQTCHSKTWRCQTAQPLYSFVKYQFSKQDFLSSPRWSRRYEINITILGFSVNLIILLLGPSCLTSGHSVPDRAEREQHSKVLPANLAQIWSNLMKKSLNTSRKMSGTDSIRLYCIVYKHTPSVTMFYTSTIWILNLDPNVCLNRLRFVQIFLKLTELFLAVLSENIECRLSVFSVFFHRQTLTNNAARGEVEIRRLAEQFPRLKGGESDLKLKYTMSINYSHVTHLGFKE